MKKIAFVIFFIIGIGIIIIRELPTIVHLYLHYFLSPEENLNTLSSTNNAVQIGYNILYLIIAIVVLLVAYFQLDKTREATTIQTLINLDTYLRSDDFLKKRKKLADLILINEFENLKIWLDNLRTKSELTNDEIEKIACVKNIFESVIYQFELVGHFYKNHVFTIEDVYQLFSIEIQNYWVLMSEIGYIRYLRETESEDFYDKFQNIFIDTLKQEIINEYSNLITKYFFKLYYWTRTYKIFYQKEYYVMYKVQNKISFLTENIKGKIPMFLQEEKNLI